MAIQICQDLDFSPNEHTHTHMLAWMPYFVKVKCIHARGNEKVSLSFLLFFRIIKHHAGSDNHNCQATDLHPTPSSHAFLGKCHFTFPSGFKFEAVHRDNLWILTCACIDNTLCSHFLICISSSPSLSWSPHLSCLLSCTPHHPFPPPHLILISPLPGLSVWFQACCVWPDLVLYDWSSNYNSLGIVFPPTANLTTYHPQA